MARAIETETELTGVPDGVSRTRGLQIATIAEEHSSGPTDRASSETDGRDALALRTRDTNPFGVVITLADAHADRVTGRLADGRQDAYDRYEVFRRAAGDRMYVVVQSLAPDRDEAILLAGSSRLRFLDDPGGRDRARRAGHPAQADRRYRGATFRHEPYEQSFPPAEQASASTPRSILSGPRRPGESRPTGRLYTRWPVPGV